MKGLVWRKKARLCRSYAKYSFALYSNVKNVCNLRTEPPFPGIAKSKGAHGENTVVCNVVANTLSAKSNFDEQVGMYDPFCDDPRLAVQKLHFDIASGQLVVGGRAGHVIVYDLDDEPSVGFFRILTFISKKLCFLN